MPRTASYSSAKRSVASIICELLEEAKAAYTLECMQPSLSYLSTCSQWRDWGLLDGVAVGVFAGERGCLDLEVRGGIVVIDELSPVPPTGQG